MLTDKYNTKIHLSSNRSFFMSQTTGEIRKDSFMNKYKVVETLTQLINTLNTFPKIDQANFVYLISEAFSDYDFPVKYDCDLAAGRLSVWVPECPQISVDISWTNAAEVARELAWFLDKFNKTYTNPEIAIY